MFRKVCVFDVSRAVGIARFESVSESQSHRTIHPVPLFLGFFGSLVFFLLGISLVFLGVFSFFFQRFLGVRQVRKILGVFEVFLGIFELLDAVFLLTIGSFLLTAELFYLQLAILAFLLAIGAFLLTVLAFVLTVGAFLLTVGKYV